MFHLSWPNWCFYHLGNVREVVGVFNSMAWCKQKSESLWFIITKSFYCIINQVIIWRILILSLMTHSRLCESSLGNQFYRELTVSCVLWASKNVTIIDNTYFLSNTVLIAYITKNCGYMHLFVFAFWWNECWCMKWACTCKFSLLSNLNLRFEFQMLSTCYEKKVKSDFKALNKFII